jgi:hypothetical protein
LKYSFSILIILLCAGKISGQASKWAPSAIRLGGDPGTLYYMVFSEERGFFEFEADVDVNRFLIVANYGISTFQLDKPTFSYSNEGTYLRFGADINFMHDDPHNNVTFFGLRYASSSFNDQLDYTTNQVIQSETGWPNTDESLANNQANARWFEMVTGIKIRVVKQLYMGFTVRYKLLMKTGGSSKLRPYYVPGFGKNIGTSAFGFNYYISYRLPFRKKTVFLDENEKVIQKK